MTGGRAPENTLLLPSEEQRDAQWQVGTRGKDSRGTMTWPWTSKGEAELTHRLEV